MTLTHGTAIVEDGARLGDNVRIGAYAVVGPNVVIEDNVVIHPQVVVRGRTRIGSGSVIHSYAVIGGPPQDLSYNDEPTSVTIGPNCTIREYATVHRGTARGRGETVVGAHCFLMLGAHVAHDCVVGDHAVLVNNATLGGHVEVGEHAILGGLSAVQQRCRIGAYVFLGGLSAAVTDVIPYASAIGNRAELGGLNVIGLKRHGFGRPAIRALRGAYQLIFSGIGTRAERLEQVVEKYSDIPGVMKIVDFIRAGGDRPLCSPRD